MRMSSLAVASGHRHSPCVSGTQTDRQTLGTADTCIVHSAVLSCVLLMSTSSFNTYNSPNGEGSPSHFTDGEVKLAEEEVPQVTQWLQTASLSPYNTANQPTSTRRQEAETQVFLHTG